MTQADARLTPVGVRDRIQTLDVLRGWAVLGILAVNVISFAWPFEVYGSRAAAPYAIDGALTGADRIGHWVTEVFFHHKFRTLFSMLFGVSIFLVGGEIRDASRGSLLNRRLVWLIVIGVLHGMVLWWGDILLHYAYCGLIMMMMRSWSAKRLLIWGGAISGAWVALSVLGALAMAGMPPEIAAKMSQGMPGADPVSVQAAVEAVRAGGLTPLAVNLKNWLILQMFSLFLIPVTLPLMMLGLGLFKAGWLTGWAPMWTYLAAIAGGAVVLAIQAPATWYELGAPVGADPTHGVAEASAGAGVVTALAYSAVLIVLVRVGVRPLAAALAPVGRMAFTNYLAQSVIMATLFYMPFGPRFYGQYGPGALWAFVVGVWAIQLIWSPLWLSRFGMGPLEWGWRCLTYGRRLPLRKPA